MKIVTLHPGLAPIIGAVITGLLEAPNTRGKYLLRRAYYRHLRTM